MGKEDLLSLRIVPEGGGCSIFLDEKSIHHVENYKIEQAELPGTAELTLKVLVRYP